MGEWVAAANGHLDVTGHGEVRNIQYAVERHANGEDRAADLIERQGCWVILGLEQRRARKNKRLASIDAVQVISRKWGVGVKVQRPYCIEAQ